MSLESVAKVLMTQMLNHFFSYDLSQYCKLFHMWLIVREKYFLSNKSFFSVIDSVNGAVKKKVGKKMQILWQ